METQASFWACDLSDLRDLGEGSSVWEPPAVFPSSSAGLMWTQQVSPQLNRNKQLQDALLQREEQLVRLQDENNQLREFLGSSFENLGRKAKKLTKRSLAFSDAGSFPDLQTSQRVSKRVCRNLTAEFCSSSNCSEPNLDLWVLRTLGLKDQDTIESPSSDYTPSVSLATSSSVHIDRSTDYMYNAAGRHKAKSRDPAKSPQTRSRSPGHLVGVGSDLKASTASRASPTAEQPPNTRTRFTAASSEVQTPEGDPTGPAAYRYPSSQHSIQFGPPFSCASPSSPCVDRLCMSGGGGGGSTLSLVGSKSCCRTDLAFSMSLSPSSSVKTLSFTQGQAFVRKDTGGRCNFTWVPTQRA